MNDLGSTGTSPDVPEHETGVTFSIDTGSEQCVPRKMDPFKVIQASITRTAGSLLPGQRLIIPKDTCEKIDKYARLIRQRASHLTPGQFANKYLTRPFRDNLAKARAIFVWVAEFIAWQGNPSERSLDQDGWDETAESTMSTRKSRGPGYAQLFHSMAEAAGLRDCRIVTGFVKTSTDVFYAPKCPDANAKWNSINIMGKVYFVDCCSASPRHPRNASMNQGLNDFFFLTTPEELIYTHYPVDSVNQHLYPPIPQHIFVMLPYVAPAYFNSGRPDDPLPMSLEVEDFQNAVLCIGENENAEIALSVPPGIECHAETVCYAEEAPLTLGDAEERTASGSETLQRRVNSRKSASGDSLPLGRASGALVRQSYGAIIARKRALAQCEEIAGSGRIARVWARLPEGCSQGWLRISSGPRVEHVSVELTFLVRLCHTCN